MSPFPEDSDTERRKRYFERKFKSTVESTFNANQYVICCVFNCCRSKYYKDFLGTPYFFPKVEVVRIESPRRMPGSSAEVDVSSGRARGIFRESGAPYSGVGHIYGAWLFEDSVESKTTYLGLSQIPAVHEFGHMIGLTHPSIGHPFWRGDYSEYAADAPALMGLGMELRWKYFIAWLHTVSGSDPGTTYQIKRKFGTIGCLSAQTIKPESAGMFSANGGSPIPYTYRDLYGTQPENETK